MTGVLTVAGLSFPASELGTTFGPTLSNPEETQMIGAFIVFALFLVWLARFHYKEIFFHAFQAGNVENHASYMENKIIFWGSCIGSLGLLAWFMFHGVSVGQATILIFFFVQRNPM